MKVADQNSQPVDIVPDQGSGYSFELDHVYTVAPTGDRRGAIQALNPGACYWRVTHTQSGETRELTYSQAAKARGRQLTLEDFGALNEIRADLLSLFD